MHHAYHAHPTHPCLSISSKYHKLLLLTCHMSDLRLHCTVALSKPAPKSHRHLIRHIALKSHFSTATGSGLASRCDHSLFLKSYCSSLTFSCRSSLIFFLQVKYHFFLQVKYHFFVQFEFHLFLQFKLLNYSSH